MNYICQRAFTSQKGKTYQSGEKIVWHQLDELEDYEKRNFSQNKSLIDTESTRFPTAYRNLTRMPSYQRTSLISC